MGVHQNAHDNLLTRIPPGHSIVFPVCHGDAPDGTARAATNVDFTELAAGDADKAAELALHHVTSFEETIRKVL